MEKGIIGKTAAAVLGGLLWAASAACGQAIQAVQANEAEPMAPTPFLTASTGGAASRAYDLEWSQGEPFVGAADGAATTSHGFQLLAEAQGPTAMLPAVSGLSLIEMGKTAKGYRLRFDEARSRYLVKLFAGGRLLRIYVVYPGQADLSIPFAKLPEGAVFLSVHNEAGNPLQSFKLERTEDAWPARSAAL
jgi:hypothetical protein